MSENCKLFKLHNTNRKTLRKLPYGAQGEIMKTPFLILAMLCLAMATSLDAQRIEGKDAPDFTMGGIVNGIGDVSKSSLDGQVIVIKVWGIT